MLKQKFCSFAGTMLKGVQKTVGNLQTLVCPIQGLPSNTALANAIHDLLQWTFKLAIASPRQQH
jgi:hypothetical protein